MDKFVESAVGFCGLRNLGLRPGQSDKRIVEVGNVAFQHRRSVALRVDTDEKDLNDFLFVRRERPVNLCQIAQCRRADVRTMRKPKGEQYGFPSKLVELKRLSLLIHEVKIESLLGRRILEDEAISIRAIGLFGSALLAIKPTEAAEMDGGS